VLSILPQYVEDVDLVGELGLLQLLFLLLHGHVWKGRYTVKGVLGYPGPLDEVRPRIQELAVHVEP
jgi:hypothetical protein